MHQTLVVEKNLFAMQLRRDYLMHPLSTLSLYLFYEIDLIEREPWNIWVHNPMYCLVFESLIAMGFGLSFTSTQVHVVGENNNKETVHRVVLPSHLLYTLENYIKWQIIIYTFIIIVSTLIWTKGRPHAKLQNTFHIHIVVSIHGWNMMDRKGKWKKLYHAG